MTPQQAIEMIKDYDGLVKLHTVHRIIEHIAEDLQDTNMSVKLSYDANSILSILLYKVNQLVGRIQFKDGNYYASEYDLSGLQLTYVAQFKTVTEAKEKVYDNFESDLPPDCTMEEAFQLLEQRINYHNPPIRQKVKDGRGRPKGDSRAVSVDQFTMDYKYIATHTNHCQAARELGTVAIRIYNAAVYGNTCKGFKWKITQ